MNVIISNKWICFISMTIRIKWWSGIDGTQINYYFHGFQLKNNCVNICHTLYVTQVSCHMLAEPQKIKLENEFKTHTTTSCVTWIVLVFRKWIVLKIKIVKNNFKGKKTPEIIYWCSTLKNGFCYHLRRNSEYFW